MAGLEQTTSTGEGKREQQQTVREEATTQQLSLNSSEPQRKIVTGKKAPNIPLFERRNWLLHLLYVRKDFARCKDLIAAILEETGGMCEYAIYVQGLILRQEGDVQGSLVHFKQAGRLNPANPANTKQYARSLFLLGRHKAALDAYSEVLLTSPQDWEVLHNKGVCYTHLKQYEEALECLTKALEIAYQTVTYQQLARVYLRMGNPKKAADVYRKAVKHNPEDSDLLATLGLLYLQLGFPQKAFESLGSALTFNECNYKATLAAGAILQEHGDYDVALRKYRTSIAIVPESPFLWNNIAMGYYSKKKFMAAISCLKRANYLAPFEWKILYNLGLIHLTLKQYASAFAFLNAALSYQPRDAQLLMLLGVALAHLKDVENSCKAYQQASNIDSDNCMVSLNLSLSLYNIDKKSEARNQFVQFETKLRQFPDSQLDPEVVNLRLKLGAVFQVGEIKGEKMKQPKQKGQDLKRDSPVVKKTSQVLEEGVQELSKEDEVVEKEKVTEEVLEMKRTESTGSAKVSDPGSTKSGKQISVPAGDGTPIEWTLFHEYVQQQLVDSAAALKQQYEQIPAETGASCEAANLACNKHKNRFSNIKPYDDSRVHLSKIDGQKGSDYINASFVDGYNRADYYIAAQGPMASTILDFWRMVWEYQIKQIVILTGLVEAGRSKCEKYWPDDVNQSVNLKDMLILRLSSVSHFSDYIIRRIQLSEYSPQGGNTLEVTQFHFQGWPDHGVPKHPTSLLNFLRRVRTHRFQHRQEAGTATGDPPTLVHCSAGVGRTGTFIMLDSMLDRLSAEGNLNIMDFLVQLRAKRMHIVQTVDQYVFLHHALDEFLICGETEIAASDLRACLNRMNQVQQHTQKTEFQQQFELMGSMMDTPGTNPAVFSDALLPENKEKNRYVDRIPYNLCRPYLPPDKSTNYSNYINASFVDGYRLKKGYIVTQGPMQNTVNDFWKMVWEFRSQTIVQLCELNEGGAEVCRQYWPDPVKSSIQYGAAQVSLQSEAGSGDYIVRQMELCYEELVSVKKQKGDRTTKEHIKQWSKNMPVTQFHYTSWPEVGLPSSASLIELVNLLQAHANPAHPIIVLCNDGVGRSGVFVCLYSEVDRLRTENEVDMFKCIKKARTQRWGLVPRLDQYVFCHQVLADYADTHVLNSRAQNN